MILLTKPMFVLFSGMFEFGSGGWTDYKLFNSDIEALKEASHVFEGDWAHIVDIEFRRICSKAVRREISPRAKWEWRDCWDG